jgi:hypothetical protein
MQTLIDGLKRARILSRTGGGMAAAAVGLVTAVPPGPAVFGIAALLALAGAIIRFWSAGIIAKNRELATSGPYAYVRNPLYLGSLLGAAGFILLNGNPWFGVPAAVAWAVVYHRTIRSEEGVLSSRFGEAFARYRATVPAILPWKGRCEVPGAEVAYSLDQSIHNKEYNGFLGILGMLVVFYAYAHWIPPVPFRVTAGVLAVAVLVLKAVRVAQRERRRAAATPEQESPQAPESPEAETPAEKAMAAGDDAGRPGT